MNETVPRFVLDACALIAYLNDEEGAALVETRLHEATAGKASVFISAVNVCEVYYDCLRVKGQEEAKQLLEEILKLPVTILRIIDNATLEAAGRLKVDENVSLADAFALAVAKNMNARVLSSDHHELDSVAEKGEIAFEWIR